MDIVLNTNDLLLLILNYATNTGKSYKICREVCINWQKLCDFHFDYRVDQYSNHLLTLMDKIPELQVYSFNISANPNISWQYICDHPEYNWGWNSVVQNPNVDWNIVKNHLLTDKILTCFISKNPNITLDIIKSTSFEFTSFESTSFGSTSFEETEIDWNWSHLSNSAKVTYKEVKENPQYHWDYCHLTMNPNITTEDIGDMIGNHNITLACYIYNPNSPWEILEKCVDKESHIFWLSCHPNVTWDIIQQNPQIAWNWNGISRNPNITWNIIQQNPQYNWDYVQFSLNPNLTWRIVINNPKIGWNRHYMSMNIFNKFSHKRK